MYKLGVITKGGEITAAEYRGDAMYVNPVPKDGGDAGEIVIVSAKLDNDEDFHDVPIMTGMWNPVFIDTIRLTGEQLAAYRWFYGLEG